MKVGRQDNEVGSGNLAKQHRDRCPSDISNRLHNGGEFRVGVRPPRKAIESHHGNIIRHPKPPVDQCLEDPKRHRVGGSEDRVGRFGQDLGGSRIAARYGRFCQLDPPLGGQPANSGKSVTETFEALDTKDKVVVRTDIGDSLAAEPDEMVNCEPCAAVVVDVDAKKIVVIFGMADDDKARTASPERCDDPFTTGTCSDDDSVDEALGDLADELIGALCGPQNRED